MHQGLCIVPRKAGSKCIIYMSFSFYLAQNSEPKQTVKNIKQLLFPSLLPNTPSEPLIQLKIKNQSSPVSKPRGIRETSVLY